MGKQGCPASYTPWAWQLFQHTLQSCDQILHISLLALHLNVHEAQLVAGKSLALTVSPVVVIQTISWICVNVEEIKHI